MSEAAVATASWQRIMVGYDSPADDGVLACAVDLAARRRAHMTVVVPVPQPSRFAALAFVDPQRLQAELEASADATARRVERRIPSDVSLTIRCVTRASAVGLSAQLAGGAFDVLVVRGRRLPAGSIERRLRRDAMRSGTPVLAVHRSRA